MSASDWLNIVINPPQKESVKAGGNIQTQVVAINQKSAGILVGISLELPKAIAQWCKHPRQSFNLNPHQSQEIFFQWQIPPQALAGTYNYALIVDSPNNFSSPLRYNRQLEISTPIHNASQKTVDPTFWLLPDTSSTKPVSLQSGQSLTVQVFVHNRSQQVDEYRLDCDLDDSWYTLHYPEGVAEPGLVRSNSQLNLLPNARGQITLVLHPPQDTFAGNYRPDIRLHSSIKPDLFLQKIFYFDIPANYDLQTNLNTILNKVRHKQGQYEIELSNRGNTIREVRLIAQTADEDELCQYSLEPASLRLAPGKTSTVNLKVKPIQQQGRSFFKAKQYNFQVKIEDLNGEPLPKNLPLKESLFWKPRPWWQFLLLLLLGGGILSGCGFLVWLLFYKPSGEPEITEFKSNYSSYEYNSKTPVEIDWSVEYPRKIRKLTLYNKNKPKQQKCYQFLAKNKNPKCNLIDLQQTPSNCNLAPSGKKISCRINTRFIPTQKPGEYNFALKAEVAKQKPIVKEISLVRNEKELASIDREKLVTNEQKYTPQQDIILQFEIENIEAVASVFLLENGEIKKDLTTNLKKICQPGIKKNSFRCKLNLGSRTDNKYIFGLKIVHDSKGYITPPKPQIIEAAEVAVETPLKLNRFAINNQTSNPITLRSGERPVVSWNVQGKGVEILINGATSDTITQNQGRKTLNSYPDGTTHRITITAKDKYGRAIEPRTLIINVESPPPPVESDDGEL